MGRWLQGLAHGRPAPVRGGGPLASARWWWGAQRSASRKPPRRVWSSRRQAASGETERAANGWVFPARASERLTRKVGLRSMSARCDRDCVPRLHPRCNRGVSGAFSGRAIPTSVAVRDAGQKHWARWGVVRRSRRRMGVNVGVFSFFGRSLWGNSRRFGRMDTGVRTLIG